MSLCPYCAGNGRLMGGTCHHCGGAGEVTVADDQFPPRVPCPDVCAYGACSGPSWSDPYGCGGCCRCLGGCHLEYDVEQAMIPETREQAENRKRWPVTDPPAPGA